MAQNGEQTGSGFFKKEKRAMDWHKILLYVALLLSLIWHVNSLQVAHQTLDLADEFIKSCAYW
ncbi:hypothetical protein V6U78_12400 [Marinospirillum sp. MEB164]|uniref:Uncharacterized protein n=1 Tax=Marinospirillum alkalitolerans TaxID=3123374 RepID=A0ABW8PZV7_9GAMM